MTGQCPLRLRNRRGRTFEAFGVGAGEAAADPAPHDPALRLLIPVRLGGVAVAVVVPPDGRVIGGEDLVARIWRQNDSTRLKTTQESADFTTRSVSNVPNALAACPHEC